MIYNKKPKDFTPDIEVVSCVLEHNGKFVLLHRQKHKTHGDKWGLPAGKIEKTDKNMEDAIIRELFEETGVLAKEEDLIFHKTFFVSHPNQNFLYHCFKLNLEKRPDVVINKEEHKAFKWVTLDEASQMPIVTDGFSCIKYIYGIQ